MHHGLRVELAIRGRESERGKGREKEGDCSVTMPNYISSTIEKQRDRGKEGKLERESIRPYRRDGAECRGVHHGLRVELAIRGSESG